MSEQSTTGPAASPEGQRLIADLTAGQQAERERFRDFLALWDGLAPHRQQYMLGYVASVLSRERNADAYADITGAIKATAGGPHA